MSAWLALPLFENNYDGSSDIAVSKTNVVKLFKEKPYIVASTAEKAAAHAEDFSDAAPAIDARLLPSSAVIDSQETEKIPFALLIEPASMEVILFGN